MMTTYIRPEWVNNTLRLRQNGRHFPDNIFKCILLNENVWNLITISLKSIPKSPINNIPALVQIMAWCRPGNKPLSEPMVVNLLTHICFTQPQWVNERETFWGSRTLSQWTAILKPSDRRKGHDLLTFDLQLTLDMNYAWEDLISNHNLFSNDDLFSTK